MASCQRAVNSETKQASTLLSRVWHNRTLSSVIAYDGTNTTASDIIDHNLSVDIDELFMLERPKLIGSVLEILMLVECVMLGI